MNIIMESTVYSFILGMLLVLCYGVGKILFVALYGEQIRQLIINIPEYKPTWFSLVDLSQPIRLWQFFRITFFVIRLMEVVFTKSTSLVNEEFKSKLSKKIFYFLKMLKIISTTGVIIAFVSGLLLWFQQS